MGKRRIGQSSPGKKVFKFFVYIVALIILIYFGTAAYHYGQQMFSAQGIEAAPGTDMTIEVSEGMSIRDLSKELQEYGIVENSNIFYIQSLIFEVKSVKPGTYTFNTSQNGEKILSTITAGPLEEQEEK